MRLYQSQSEADPGALSDTGGLSKPAQTEERAAHVGDCIMPKVSQHQQARPIVPGQNGSSSPTGRGPRRERQPGDWLVVDSSRHPVRGVREEAERRNPTQVFGLGMGGHSQTNPLQG
jgi:hypothetical protein